MSGLGSPLGFSLGGSPPEEGEDGESSFGALTLVYPTDTSPGDVRGEPLYGRDARYVTAWTPDLSSISESIVTVTVTIEVGFTGQNLWGNDTVEFWIAEGSTDDGDHGDQVNDLTGNWIGVFELPIQTDLPPTVYTQTFRMRKAAFTAPIFVAMFVEDFSGDVEPHLVTVYSVNIVIAGEMLTPCAPFVLAPSWETTATNVILG